MKKIFFMMFAAVLFTACGSDDNGGSGDIPPADDKPVEEQTISFADYSQTIGISYRDMLTTYSEPSMSYDGFYSYDVLNDSTTESLILMTNPETNNVYYVSQILAENAYQFEDICNYFARKYTMYSKQDAGVMEEDGEEYEIEASAKFGNAEKEENATLLITVSGNSSVYYIDPTNMPTEPEGSDFSDVAPENVPALFLGRSWEDVEDEYGESITKWGDYLMINVADNEYYTCIFFTVEDDIVTEIKLMFDDLEEDDVITYYKELGYTAMDCGEEDGVHTYLFINSETGDMFTYSNPVATFVYVDPNAEDEEEDYEDYEDYED